MRHGETTKRSRLDAEAIVARLQARGVEQLRGEAAIWVLVDGSDLRKPHAQAMEALQRVKPLKGAGTVPGYRTLNALGVGRQRRGLLYHRLFSSAAEGFLSESAEPQAALASLGRALAPVVAGWLVRTPRPWFMPRAGRCDVSRPARAQRAPSAQALAATRTPPRAQGCAAPGPGVAARC